jgi:hypothetical protein
MRSRLQVAAWLCCATALAHNVFAQGELIAYPPEGRAKSQQQLDQFECHQWAVEQSGFDPVQAAQVRPVSASTGVPASAGNPQSGTGAPGRALIGGAAQGAAISAVAEGDAAKGAATGAGIGLLRKKMAERKAAEQEAQRLAQIQHTASQQRASESAALQARHHTYERARGTCFRARGYTVSEG